MALAFTSIKMERRRKANGTKGGESDGLMNIYKIDFRNNILVFIINIILIAILFLVNKFFKNENLFL